MSKGGAVFREITAVFATETLGCTPSGYRIGRPYMYASKLRPAYCGVGVWP
ncbi:hypothetical protein LBMAG38_24130 [Chloroflexota bacterium]|nr:hypothetical protein LBMAG38_24130 [Chloroflexota bacterium]